MESTRQAAPLKALRQFLFEHESCGAGFDVSHPNGLGSGRVSTRCRGCEAVYEYTSEPMELERTGELAVAPGAAAGLAVAPREEIDNAINAAVPSTTDVLQQPLPPAAKSAPGSPPRRRRRSPWPAGGAIRAGLAVFALAVLVLAAVRLLNQSGEDSGNEQTIETKRFTLTVPRAWEQRRAAGGFMFSPPGNGPVSVQVYYEEAPGMGVQAMISQTVGFLRSRDNGAHLSRPQRLEVGGRPSFKLAASGPAGSQVALGVLAGPYRYLAIESVDPGAPGIARAQAARALSSFKAR